MKAILPLFLLLPACNWITQSDIDERLPQLDNDGDGFTRNGKGDPSMADCDDTNRDIFPGAEEIWYDGIDQDCAGDDDYDQDADGFRSEAETEDGTDCNDTSGSIYPDAPDDWYDGVDSDCAENDDYDQDADGYRSDANPDLNGEVGEDCNDLDKDIAPSADEIWYDGVDQDCAGDDDYDKDADGFRSANNPDVDTNQIGDDCNDELASTFPGADEVWYDGEDADCLGDDDYDQDVDGFRSDAHPDLNGEVGEDCDDTKVEVNPAALERIGESNIDYDCDPNHDPLGIASYWESPYTWTGIGSIRLGERQNTDQNGNLFSEAFVSVVANEFIDSTDPANPVTYYDLGVAPYWDTQDLSDWEATGVVFWSTKETSETTADTNVVTGHDILIDGDNFYGVMGRISTTGSRNMVLYRKDLTTSDPADDAVQGGSSEPDLQSVTLFRDGNNDYRYLGCSTESGGSIFYVLTSEDTIDDPLTGLNFKENIPTNGGPEGCVAQMVDTNAANLWYTNAGNNGSLERYFLDVSANSSSSDLTLNFIDSDSSIITIDLDYHRSSSGDDWSIQIDTAGGVHLKKNGTLLIDSVVSGAVPSQASLAYDAAQDRAIAAITMTDGSVHLYWPEVDANGVVADPTNPNIASVSTSFLADKADILVLDGGSRAMVAIHNSSNLEIAYFEMP